MGNFRQQVKEMKMWMIPFWIGMAMLIFSLLFIGYIIASFILAGGLSHISEKFLIFGINITIFSPVLSGMFMVLSGIGIGRRKRCSKCGKVLTIREFDQMGDEFLCPYCSNREFGKY